MHPTVELSSASSVHHTAESDSAVCILPRSKAPRCASHRGVKLLGVPNTAESIDQKVSKNSDVCISLQSLTLWVAFHCGVELCCVHSTTESSSTVCMHHTGESSVCIYQKVNNYYFSITPEDIIMKILLFLELF